jgi:hypothetical protein
MKMETGLEIFLKRISNIFPDARNVFFKIINKIDRGEIIGKQTDWGSWTAILYPSELGDVIKELYGEEACTKIIILAAF